MRTFIIVQARMGSSRLPGKILMEVNGKPLLEYQIERLRQMKASLPIVLATTVEPEDYRVQRLGDDLGVSVFRGSEKDVLGRYYHAAMEVQADALFRITADCPLIDPFVLDEIYNMFISRNVDYCSNTLERTFPRGLDAEIFRFQALKEAHFEAKSEYDREHVTPFIRTQPNRYKLASYRSSSGDFSKHRWTVDTPEDFELIRHILSTLYPKNLRFRMSDVLSILAKNPAWVKLNAHIEQK